MWWEQKSRESPERPSSNWAAPGLEASFSCQVGKPHISNVQSRRRQSPVGVVQITASKQKAARASHMHWVSFSQKSQECGVEARWMPQQMCVTLKELQGYKVLVLHGYGLLANLVLPLSGESHYVYCSGISPRRDAPLWGRCCLITVRLSNVNILEQCSQYLLFLRCT